MKTQHDEEIALQLMQSTLVPPTAHIRINLGEHQMMLTKKAVERAGDPNCGPAKAERMDWNTPLVCHRQGPCVCGGVVLECHNTDYVPLTPTEAAWRAADRHNENTTPAAAAAPPKVQKLVDDHLAKLEAIRAAIKAADGGHKAPPAPPHDDIKRPEHYARFAIEPCTFIMANELPFWAGNVIKYVCRAPHKHANEEVDIRKAIRYCEMRLELLKREREGTDGEVEGRPL